jgi:hypothetical protein
VETLRPALRSTHWLPHQFPTWAPAATSPGAYSCPERANAPTPVLNALGQSWSHSLEAGLRDDGDGLVGRGVGYRLRAPEPKHILDDLNLEAAERRLCVATFELTGNIGGAAQLLGIPGARSSAA